MTTPCNVRSKVSYTSLRRYETKEVFHKEEWEMERSETQTYDEQNGWKRKGRTYIYHMKKFTKIVYSDSFNEDYPHFRSS